MQFIQSFSSLGYSAIVLVLTVLFIWGAIYNVFKLQNRGWVPKIILFAVMAAIVYFATIFLAAERTKMIEAIREEGGLKRTLKR